MNEQKNTTKTQIKQAAIRQIEKFGIDKTSMRSIAAEANMTTGAIYYYYKNKQDLFDEIVTDSIHFAHRIFHENENEKITVDSLFSDVEKEARIRFKRLQEEKLYLLLLSDAMKCDSEFSQKYTSGLKSILDQAATLFASAFALDDRKLAEQFASIFMATLDGFAIQQVLHTIPKDDTSYADTLLDFFTTCVPYYIEKHREVLFFHLGTDHMPELSYQIPDISVPLQDRFFLYRRSRLFSRKD